MAWKTLEQLPCRLVVDPQTSGMRTWLVVLSVIVNLTTLWLGVRIVVARFCDFCHAARNGRSDHGAT